MEFLFLIHRNDELQLSDVELFFSFWAKYYLFSQPWRIRLANCYNCFLLQLIR